MALRLDGYIRVSRIGGREGEGYISPDVQRQAIERYASEVGGQIVAWFDDQDYSGGNIDRPGFMAILGRLAAGESDGVVVMSIDRFSRSTADGSTVVKTIVDRGQVFASCHERIDPTTDEGRYMLRSFLSNAELFLDQVKTRWRTAKGRAIARGAHIGPTPNGYLKVDALPTKPTHISPVHSAALGGTTSPGVLVPRPVYGEAMSELFERAAMKRYGDTALARWMTERAPRASGAPWNSGEVRRWLSNRVYLGEVRYGPTLVNPDAHKPLTTPPVWNRCQREPGERRQAPSPFLLSGLIRCAGCRYAMGGQNHGGSKGETRVYRCPRSNRGCPEPSVIVAERVESHLIGLVEQQLAGLKLAEKERPADDSPIEEFDLAALEVETFASDVTARRLLGEEAWQTALRLRAEARDALRPARDSALAAQSATTLSTVEVDDLSHQALRGFLGELVRHIFVRRLRGMPASDRVTVVWRSDLDIDTPGPHRPGPFEPVRW